jgi:GR25 family glycosyltransferase involved in LPS biosynthesis
MAKIEKTSMKESNIIKLILCILFFILIYFLLTKENIRLHGKKYTVYTRIYAINLKETKEGKRRWGVLKTHPEFKEKIERHQGIYGADYDCSEEIKDGIIMKEWDFGRWKNPNTSKMIRMTDGEIGVSLSHYNLWKKISELNNEGDLCHLILEDDATRTCRDFNEKITTYMKHLPDDWDIFLLGFWLHRGDDGYKINKYISKVKTFVLCHSYIIREKSAYKLLKCTPIDMPLDSWMSKHSEYINIYRHNYCSKSLKPGSYLISQAGIAKQISNTNNW